MIYEIGGLHTHKKVKRMTTQEKTVYMSSHGHFYCTRDEYLHEEGYWDAVSGIAPQTYYVDEDAYLMGYKAGSNHRKEVLEFRI